MAGSIPGTGPILRVLKYLRNEDKGKGSKGTAFALQMARPSLGSDDYVKWRSSVSSRKRKK